MARMSRPKPPTADLFGLMADPDFDMKATRPIDREVQGSLFPVDVLDIPESVRNMRKGVGAIHAISARPELVSLNRRKLQDAFILLAQLECRGWGPEALRRLREDRVSPVFEVGIARIAEVANIPGKNYQRIYEDIDKLFGSVLLWNILGEESEVVWELKAPFFSLLGYGKNYKRGMVRFAFDPAVLALFLEPSVWARLSLDAMGLMGDKGISGSAAYALFQNCWRYFGTQNKVTAALPVHIWVELLVGKGRYITKAANGQEVVDYGEFKRRMLTKAIAQVNECVALSHKLELKEHKQGNRVVKLQFKFVEKPARQEVLPLTWNKELIHVLAKIGYTAEDVDGLSKIHTMDEVGEALTRLTAAEARQKKLNKPITSRRAYFEGILRNISRGAAPQEDEKLEAELRAKEAQRQAEERKKKLLEMFHKRQHGIFATWFEAQSEDVRTSLVAEMLADPALGKGDVLLCKSLATAPTGASLIRLRAWMDLNKPALMEEILPNPEDRAFDDWLTWRATGGDVIND